MLGKYVIIFWLKSPAALHNPFWSLYINLWVIMTSWITQFTFEVMLEKGSYHVKMCSGLPPSSSQSNLALTKTMNINNLFKIITICIHLVIWTRVQIYKRKTARHISIIGISNTKKSWIKKLEQHSLSDMINNICSVLCLFLIAVIQFQLKVNHLTDFNVYPYYLFEYFYSMIKAPVMFALLLILLLVRNQQLNKALFRYLKLITLRRFFNFFELIPRWPKKIKNVPIFLFKFLKK
jgi:hypothetical protein